MCQRNSIGTVSVTLETGVSESVRVDCIQTGEQRVDVTLKVPGGSVERWFPVGYGAQPLYRLKAAYRGFESDQRVVNVGFRTATLVTEKLPGDEETMQFRVNGIDVFIRGSNFIPMDVFESRITERDIDRWASRGRCTQDAGGGGPRESEHDPHLGRRVVSARLLV